MCILHDDDDECLNIMFLKGVKSWVFNVVRNWVCYLDMGAICYAIRYTNCHVRIF